MAISSANTTRVALVPETTWGVTPATPAFKTLRVTGESLSNSRQTITSNEMRGSDRNVSDSVQVSESAEGSINFELSYGTFDDIIESFMFNTWTTNTITNSNSVTPKSFTIEKKFSADEDVYYRFRGMIANQFSLSTQATQVVTGSWSFFGQGADVSNAIVTGATYANPSTTPSLNAVANFSNLSILGLASPKIRSISLNGTNNMRTQMQVGSFAAAGITPGRFELTGSIEAYLQDRSMIQKYLDNEAGSLSFTLGASTGNKYSFYMPRVRLETCQVTAGGNDQDVVIQSNFRAIVGEGAETFSLKITRAVT